MPFVPDSAPSGFVPDSLPPQEPPQQPQSIGDKAKEFGSGVANAAERSVGGSLINAITFIPDVAVQLSNVAGGAVDKVLGIKEPNIDLPSSFWQGKLDKVTKPPTSLGGKIAEGATTALGAGALGGLATGAEKVEQTVARGLRTAEKEPQLTRITTKAAEDAMTAGYDLSPAYVGGAIGKGVQSAVGKAATHRAASIANESITDKLAKLSIGLSPKAELTPENLEKLEKEEFESYAAARAMGRLGRDDEFFDKIRAAGERFRIAPRERAEVWTPEGFEREGQAPQETYTFPGIEQLKARYLDTETMSAKSALDDIRSLRYSARANLTGIASPNDRALGYVQRQIADALEDRLDRAAQKTNNKSLIQELRASRVRLAKINTIRDVLGPGGHVRGADLARIDEAQPGLLTDGLKLIAGTAKNFPKDTQLISEKGGEGSFSVVDYLLGGSGIVTGHPAVSGLSLARPLAKSALLSEGTQRNMLSNIGKRSEPPSKLGQSVSQSIGRAGRAAGRGALISAPESLAGNQDFGDQGP